MSGRAAEPAGRAAAPDESAARQAIVAACRALRAEGLTHGTSGNIGVRHGARLLVTPSAVPYDGMTPEEIASVELASEDGAWSGPLRPSVEWRMHRDILRARPELGAVVHAHAPYATALAVARKAIPACHYMIAAFGGEIRCAPYARFGTAELSAAAVRALEGRRGCLLANHGMVTAGEDLAQAMVLAVELEALARVYWQALLIGGPALLTEAELAEAAAGFADYRPSASAARMVSRTAG